MTGQGEPARECAWCGLPAVGDVQSQPARFRTVSRVDPLTGRRAAHQQLVQAEIRVWVCDEHHHITSGQPPAPGVPKERKTREHVDELDLLAPPAAGAGGSGGRRAGGAIHGHTGRR